MKKNRLFILGAGFSAAAGIPLTAELLVKTMQKFSVECPGIFSRVDNYARESVEDIDSPPDYAKIDFSDLCTFLEYIELKEYGGGERWSNAGSREKLALRFYIAKTLAEHTPSEKEIPDLYVDFAEQLHKRDIVISFNWDGLLEVALQKLGKPYTYNFRDESAIKLCKLHGSINWRLNEPRNRHGLQSKLNWESLRFKEGVMDTEIFQTPALLQFEAWENDPLEEIEPFLVLPGYGKAFDVRSNATSWYKPEAAIFTTHDIFIIGLSLAPDDFFIRSLFLSNLPFVKGDDDRQIHIINPDPNVGKNYEFILNNDWVKWWQESFSMKHIEFIKNRLAHNTDN